MILINKSYKNGSTCKCQNELVDAVLSDLKPFLIEMEKGREKRLDCVSCSLFCYQGEIKENRELRESLSFLLQEEKRSKIR